MSGLYSELKILLEGAPETCVLNSSTQASQEEGVGIGASLLMFLSPRIEIHSLGFSLCLCLGNIVVESPRVFFGFFFVHIKSGPRFIFCQIGLSVACPRGAAMMTTREGGGASLPAHGPDAHGEWWRPPIPSSLAASR